MRKTRLALCALFGLCAAALSFGQATSVFTLDLRADALSYTFYGKDYADDLTKVDQLRVFNNSTISIPKFDMGIDYNLYSPKGNYGARLWLFLFDQADPSIAVRFSAYNGWIKLGPFKLWMGNSELYGLTDQYRFDVFYDKYLYDFYTESKLTTFGVILPDALSMSVISPYYTLDNNNLSKTVDGKLNKLAVVAEYNYGPMTLSLSDLGGFLNQTTPPERKDTAVAFGARAGFKQKTETLTLEATFKYGGNKHTDSGMDGRDFDDGKYSIGLYGGLQKIPWLNSLRTGFGYTAYFRTRSANTGLSYSYPLFNGVDLHFQYSGIRKTLLTFNNNFSFAFANASSADEARGIPLRYAGNIGDLLDSGDKNNYFTYTGMFGGAYMISNNLTGDLQLGFQAASTNIANGDDSVKEARIRGAVYAGVVYRLDNHAAIRGGFAMKTGLDKVSYSPDNPSAISGVSTEIGIPVAVKIVW
ncbi:MAG: hypothetical protein FWH38_04510 [Treponema sp.]|nr:hypothetical protein [Treponema sp.]